MRRFLSAFAPALALVALVLVAYGPVLDGGFIWDDDGYVEKNDNLRTVEGLRDIWLAPMSIPQYYPLVHTLFWVQYQSWGLEPFGFHLVNVAVHALGALVLWRLLAALRLPAAWLCAAIFALHPIQVESVAWITELKNVLSGLFYFAAALVYVRFEGLDRDDCSVPRRWGLYAFAFLLFLCALGSKTVTASLPAALILLIWWKRGRVTRRCVIPLVPLFVVGVVCGLFTAYFEKARVGAVGAEWDLSLIERVQVAGRVVWFYAAKLAWPTNLTFIYPRWEIDGFSALSSLFPLAAVVVITLLWVQSRRIGRGPIVAVLLFVGTLVPCLGFIDVYPFRYSFVADHFQYHAGIGLIVLGVAGGRRVLRRASVRRAVAAALVLLLTFASWRQGHAYTDIETLWRDTLAKNPSAWIAHNNLGALLQKRGEYADARVHFAEAIRLKPDHVGAHYNLGIVEEELGNLGQAERHLRSALEFSPNHAKARNNLSIVLSRRGKYGAAADLLLEALEIDPTNWRTLNNLGVLYMQSGDPERAVDAFERALELRPSSVTAHVNLGHLRADAGEHRAAVAHFASALEHGSNEASVARRLAWILATSPDEAVRDGNESRRLAEECIAAARRPSAEELATLAAALAELGRFDEAARAQERAIDAAAPAARMGLRAPLRLYRRAEPLREP